MTFEKVRQPGTSILASAGIVGIIIGYPPGILNQNPCGGEGSRDQQGNNNKYCKKA
jgi:hypothetical protein